MHIATIHPEHRKSEVSVEGIPYKIYVPIALRISARCAEAGLVLLCHQSIILFAMLFGGTAPGCRQQGTSSVTKHMRLFYIYELWDSR